MSQEKETESRSSRQGNRKWQVQGGDWRNCTNKENVITKMYEKAFINPLFYVLLEKIKTYLI